MRFRCAPQDAVTSRARNEGVSSCSCCGTFRNFFVGPKISTWLFSNHTPGGRRRESAEWRARPIALVGSSLDAATAAARSLACFVAHLRRRPGVVENASPQIVVVQWGNSTCEFWECRARRRTCRVFKDCIAFIPAARVHGDMERRLVGLS